MIVRPRDRKPAIAGMYNGKDGEQLGHRCNITSNAPVCEAPLARPGVDGEKERLAGPSSRAACPYG